jgi:hypothetical protein
MWVVEMYGEAEKISKTSVATVPQQRRQKACWHSIAYTN